MPDSLINLSCGGFSEQLSSKAPVPGGGGAAALIGSLAAALGTMATNLTIGKKKFLPFEEDHRRIIAEADVLRLRLLALMDEDAAAFEPPGYTEKLTAATLDACRVPFEMMECCCKLTGLLEELREKCSVLLLSDVGCAALAARCALESASLNVFVNTRMIPENEEATAMSKKADSMLQEYIPRAQVVADSVMSYLRKTK